MLPNFEMKQINPYKDEENEMNGSIPEFVQKLYRILEDSTFINILFWNENGDGFIIKDSNEFSKTVLPQHYKHSNFASFVRQLNKYDFHKVRAVEEGQKSLGDQTSEFAHPLFLKGRKELLEKIKRKMPGTKQKKSYEVVQNGSDFDIDLIKEIQKIKDDFKSQMDELKETKDNLENSINQLLKTESLITTELANLNQSIAAKDNLVRDFLKLISNHSDKPLSSYIPSTDSRGLMNKTKQLYQTFPIAQSNFQPHPPRVDHEIAAAAASMNAGSLIGSPLKNTDGLTFVTFGRLSSNMALRDNKPAIEIMAAEQNLNLPSSSSLKRKHSPSTQVSWTVPPRVLLVDDDSVYRDLSGKLLSIIGCTIDLAKDGDEALKKMGLEKYDLILMDIVMPKMDGISATRSIRQYDALTPIISMTSNFTEGDIEKYIDTGMTDILPKPFSKHTLYQMLEKHCAHLKAIQQVQGLESPSLSKGINSLKLIHMKNDSSSETFQTSPNLPFSSPSTTTSDETSPNTFPLAPYPYPVTMNSVPIQVIHEQQFQNNISNLTFWPQNPHQQQDQPPAIIPSDNGKFTWAIPKKLDTVAQTYNSDDTFHEKNKRVRMDQP